MTLCRETDVWQSGERRQGQAAPMPPSRQRHWAIARRRCAPDRSPTAALGAVCACEPRCRRLRRTASFESGLSRPTRYSEVRFADRTAGHCPKSLLRRALAALRPNHRRRESRRCRPSRSMSEADSRPLTGVLDTMWTPHASKSHPALVDMSTSPNVLTLRDIPDRTRDSNPRPQPWQGCGSQVSAFGKRIDTPQRSRCGAKQPLVVKRARAR